MRVQRFGPGDAIVGDVPVPHAELARLRGEPQPLIAFSQSLLGSLAFGDVDGDAADADDLALRRREAEISPTGIRRRSPGARRALPAPRRGPRP